MKISDEAKTAIAKTIGRVREIEAEMGVTQAAVQAFEAEAAKLALQDGLFDEADFPNPGPGQPAKLYPLSEDADGRFALYLVCANPAGSVRPHNHGTWAVVAGISGVERNMFYDRATGGDAPGPATLALRETVEVRRGETVGMLPDDIHSVATPGDVPRRHLHMYGLSLERLPRRLAWDEAAGRCDYMEINPKIVR